MKLTPEELQAIADDTQNLAPSTFMKGRAKGPEVKLPPPQPAHGEPWRGDSDGIYNALGERLSHHENDCGEIARTVQCVNLLSPHPDLSAVEVHSKETMDEVRATLTWAQSELGKHTRPSPIDKILAKLNPQ